MSVKTNDAVVLKADRQIPADAIAAGMAGLGLAIGFTFHAFTASVYFYFAAMICGGAVAVPEAIHALRNRRLDVHALMIAAAIGAAAIGRPGEGAMLLFLFALSGALEEFALGRTKSAINSLIKLRPAQARRKDGSMVPIESIAAGDLLIVHPAEGIPIDGEVVSGISSIDQAVMTGESEPVSRTVGDRVVGGTLNLDGILTIRATAACRDSALERVIEMVERAQDEKSLAASERLADRVGQYYAPIVLASAVLWYLSARYAFHIDSSAATYRALTLLVAASPCALVLSSPAAILSALAAAGRNGLLIRSGSVLEALAKVDYVAFDKTGTLTTGTPRLQWIWTDGCSQDILLAAAAGAEAAAPHPLAKALVRSTRDRGLELPKAVNHREIPGKGVCADIDSASLRVGHPDWAFADVANPQAMVKVEEARAAGYSVVAIRLGTYLGLAAFSDELRPESVMTLNRLRTVGIKDLVMLTGDHDRAAQYICRHLPLTEVRSELTPQDKAKAVQDLTATGRVVAMVGDGVNDAPALAGSAVGITLGGIGSDVALDSADVVIMKDNLSGVPEAISRARRARKTAIQNVAISLIGVVALTLTVIVRGIALPWAVVLHEGVTVIVVLNGVRLMWS